MPSIVQTARVLATLAMTAAMITGGAACGPTAGPEAVRGPDGEPAYLVGCGDAAECYSDASKLCNGPYVIRESHGVNGYPPTQVPVGDRLEMLVSCRADLPSTEASAPSDRSDPRVCRAASKYLVDFGAYWAKQWGASLLDEHPQADDFVETCQAMPQNVQRCMHEKYRKAHAQACQALLVRLDGASRTRIDALFLQVPTGPQGPPPGTTL